MTNNNPKPFCFNKSRVKAFVLGADPSNASDKGKDEVSLHSAFGIGENPNYFREILANLNRLDLHLEDLYIQNLLPESQGVETDKNPDYIKNAAANAAEIAAEFNKIDSSRKIPVFLTAEAVYKAVMKDGQKRYAPKELYSLQAEIPIPASANLLGRPLIPLFRHREYALEKWEAYESIISSKLKVGG